ncbi:MAG: hypothetical protein WBH52_22020, partial [Pseudomonas aeruginosa]
FLLAFMWPKSAESNPGVVLQMQTAEVVLLANPVIHDYSRRFPSIIGYFPNEVECAKVLRAFAAMNPKFTDTDLHCQKAAAYVK